MAIPKGALCCRLGERKVRFGRTTVKTGKAHNRAPLRSRFVGSSLYFEKLATASASVLKTSNTVSSFVICSTS